MFKFTFCWLQKHFRSNTILSAPFPSRNPLRVPEQSASKWDKLIAESILRLSDAPHLLLTASIPSPGPLLPSFSHHRLLTNTLPPSLPPTYLPLPLSSVSTVQSMTEGSLSELSPENLFSRCSFMRDKNIQNTCTLTHTPTFLSSSKIIFLFLQPCQSSDLFLWSLAIKSAWASWSFEERWYTAKKCFFFF